MIWAWVAAQAVLAIAGVLAAGGSRTRRAITTGLLAMVIAVPLIAPLAPLQTVVLCFVSIVMLLKTMQIAASGSHWPAGRRLWHLFGVVDTRPARRVPPSLDVRGLGVVFLNGLLLVAALAALTSLGGLSGFARTLAWVLAAATLAYASFEVLSGLVHFAYLAGGVDLPTLQRNPIASRSLAEFWGQRWNRVVGGWLREFFFAPLARRRRPQLGLAAAFGASAAIHAWLIFALGAEAAAMMAAYFLLQGAALFVESRIGLRRAPPILGRAWAIGVLLAPLPLLLGPWTQALGTAYFGLT